MIRRGWQETAATVAPHVPDLADLLERRLGEAQRVGSPDEASLLAIVDAATQLAANSGAVAVAPALSKRLRRHVYEYLLSLDAAGDSRIEPEKAGITPLDGKGPLIGADEVAALGRDREVSLDAGGEMAIFGSEAQPADVSDPVEAGGKSEAASPSALEPLPDAVAQESSSASGSLLPRFSFHIGDPDDMLAAAPPPGEHETNGTHAALPELFEPLDLHPSADAPAPRRTTFGDPSTWPTPTTPHLRGSRGPGTVSARSGEPARGVGRPHPAPAAESLATEPPLEAASAHAAGGEAPYAAPEASTAASLGSDAAAPFRSDAAERGGPAGQLRAVSSADPVDLELAPALDLASASAVGAEAMPGVPPVSERELGLLRSAVEERLRKKRCDEAARLCQRAAEELGGHGVAAIALDAGDRCHSLGKRNAALNCYLAASRADPVFESPLARLADICTDDRDIDLAVSYLERIARLTRLRGDQRGALRIYRKIATIAPYRDDVLEMLMRAETSGRID